MKAVLLFLFALVFLPVAFAGDIASDEASGELGVGTGTRSDVPFSDASGVLGVGSTNDQGQDFSTAVQTETERTADWWVGVGVITLIFVLFGLVWFSTRRVSSD